MGEYKIALGIFAIIIGFLSYIPYILGIVRREVKPHVFSWFVWGCIAATAFFAQFVGGGGSGSWVTGIGALVNFVIFAVAFSRGEHDIRILDWIGFCGAIGGLLMWKLTNNPISAIILVSSADALGFLPTIRKAIHKPDEENASMYFLSAVKWAVALFALQAFTVATWLYPASLIFTNGSAFAIIVLRRRAVKTRAQA